MVSSALLRSCANVRSSFATSGGILSEVFPIIRWSGAPASLTGGRQPVDISVVAPEPGALPIFSLYADMAELADALGSGPSDRKVVEVRVLLSAPNPRSKVRWQR